MYEASLWFKFAIVVFATWRITHLLALEDGPLDIIVRFRARIGDGIIGQLMDCFMCLSIWVAAPMAFFVFYTLADRMIGWLAISGASCLLENISQQPLSIHPVSLDKEGGNEDGMLRTETSGTQPSGDKGYNNSGAI